MGTTLTAFACEAFAAFANLFLEILASPCRRVSVGVDCEPWSMEDPSVIEVTPHLIAEAILQQFGLLPHGCLDPSLIDQLSRVPDFTCPTVAGKSSGSISSNRKEKARILSSNQIFLGLCQSPRAYHLMSIHAKMGVGMRKQFPEISHELNDIFEGYVNTHELISLTRPLANALKLRTPPVRQRVEYFCWLSVNRDQALPLLHQNPRPYM
jgi:hypothetical protein